MDANGQKHQEGQNGQEIEGGVLSHNEGLVEEYHQDYPHQNCSN